MKGNFELPIAAFIATVSFFFHQFVESEQKLLGCTFEIMTATDCNCRASTQ